jgi:hypothetical protein
VGLSGTRRGSAGLGGRMAGLGGARRGSTGLGGAQQEWWGVNKKQL